MDTKSVMQRLRKDFVRGFVILIPTILTVFILSFALQFISSSINPIASVLESLINQPLPDSVFDLLTISILFIIILCLGFISELLPTVTKLTNIFHKFVESIPGIGSVYSSFRQMSETMVQGETSFRDVKLVEYPSDDCYTLAFVTSENNDLVDEAVGTDTITLFVPMAPNPFMGGFVINLPSDRIYEVDLTVSEGIQAIITSGVTIDGENSADESVEIDRKQFENQ